MKAYYRMSFMSADKMAEMLTEGIDLKNSRYFTLTAIDFGDGIVNMRNIDEYNKYEDKIEEFIKTNNEAIVYSLNINNIIEHCEDDNIVEFDLSNYSVHIGYPEEFGI